MELKYAKIKNFRSIENLTFDFDPKCKIMVGLNEAGKSNILKALSFLDEANMPKPEDVRQPLPDEPPIEESYIWFVFSLNEDEKKHVYEEVKKKILTKNIANIIIKDTKNEYNLLGFCMSRSEGLYQINISNSKRNYSYWSTNSKYTVANYFKKVNPNCPNDYSISDNDEKFLLKNYEFVDISTYTDIPSEYICEATKGDISALVGRGIMGKVRENIPKTIFWSFNEKYLLPSKIGIDQFAQNPEICIPLKNMFNLAGYTDINQSIINAQSTSVGFRNLLNRVADRTTKHFKSVWKEYKNIQFELFQNGQDIDACIKDSFNNFDFSQRSDGFKRFVTFLLMISSQFKTGELKNVLLLIDEPDICLHPSGIRYLRDELINIASKNNYVVLSTHSIFMIDNLNIERHLIVEKLNEKTSTKDVSESNIVEEEILYNALGYSVFENLKKENIIFEGWRDKKLFCTAIRDQKIPSKYNDLKKAFKDIGICHSNGVKFFKAITPILELSQRLCLIISDNDKPAKERQKQYKSEKGYGAWYTYSEIDDTCLAITGEDFVKVRKFLPVIEKVRAKYANLPELTEDELKGINGKINILTKWLQNNGLQNEEAKNVIEEIKSEIFDDLKQVDIEESYYDFLQKLKIIIAEIDEA